jgi:glycosyltransferase involved in cell wall biosynthesis
LLDSILCKFFNINIKTVHTFHYGNYPKLPLKYIFIERIFSRFADKLVAVGNVQKEKIKKTLQIGNRSIVTVYNGVPKISEKCPFPLVEQYHQKGFIIVGTVCTLIEQKGLTQLIDVAFEIKKMGRKALFLVAGEGHLRASLEEKARKLGLNDDVIFFGWVDNACYTFLPHIDIFFLPSLWEAMSVVVLEAMEAGKPVVVTDVGENRYVIEDGVDGFLVASGKTQPMADIISRLIEDPELRFKTGEKARVKIRTQFSVERMVSAYQALYTNG